ncbi:hypothetical protein C7999DRAFT_39861 [Corynascus novoguineensis]|uniref:Rhodopsin domain-containing protein n=1 Tax=Corynascus novoguineensis TaxID=1126955 RepID=A0AAN7CW37_9PEZI|nr:hypothetical protein C7999DRAFT_39861 [Corynascus novoguineensis]
MDATHESSANPNTANGVIPDQYADPLATTPEQLASLPHDNAGPKLNTVIWTLTAVSGLILCLRIYCRVTRRKGLWWDDAFLIAAWMCITVESALLTYMTTLGYGLHIWDFNVMENMPRILIPSTFGITLLQLTDGGIKKVTWAIIISMNIAMALSAQFPWMIWKMQMQKKEKIGVGIAMSMGILAGITGLVKASQIPRMLSDDFANGVELWLWGNAETAVTIIAASIPMLRVMIRDAANSRRAHGFTGYFSDNNGLGSLKQTRIVTITSGPMASDAEVEKQINDNDSDKGMLDDSHGEILKMGAMVHKHDFQVQYNSWRDPGPDEPARYVRTGVAPPPKANNRTRFKSFLNRINRRQWELLSDVVHGKVAYNKQNLSLYEFTVVLKHEFAPKTNITMDIITSVAGNDEGDGSVIARLRVSTLITDGPCLPSTARKRSEYARHMVVYFSDTKINRIYDISDADEKQTLSQRVVPPPSLRPPPPRTSIDLRQFYADYIACINSGKMAEGLHRFCSSSGVVWNGTRFTVEQYGDMIQSSLDAISGLFFDIHTLVVDKSRQQIAARLEFTGTPVKPFAGGVPNGRPVAFAEHVFYWLDRGKISDVLTIVDWEDYRSQLAR